MDLEKHTVVELKQLLKAAGLPLSGKKADLITRLQSKPTADTSSVQATEVIPFFGQKGKYGPLSNWFYAEFTDDDESKAYYATEQYMMYQKALLFDDKEIADRILNLIPEDLEDKTSTSKIWRKYMADIKKLGREVKNFDEKVWSQQREDIMKKGLFLKFSQNEYFRQLLLDTGDATIVEAAPRDRIWGVGVGVDKAKDPKNWKGQNLLGKSLMAVRTQLSKE
jgi:ribA/ribD-fused uncharacterized protein